MEVTVDENKGDSTQSYAKKPRIFAISYVTGFSAFSYHQAGLVVYDDQVMIDTSPHSIKVSFSNIQQVTYKSSLRTKILTIKTAKADYRIAPFTSRFNPAMGVSGLIALGLLALMSVLGAWFGLILVAFACFAIVRAIAANKALRRKDEANAQEILSVFRGHNIPIQGKV